MTVRVAAHESPSLSPPNLHDVREEALVLGVKREDVRKKRGRRRKWPKITGICLHQTAVVIGERPGRWASLGAHLGITRSGKIIWVHDFNQIVYHGNRWNAGTVGIEIDGGYEGVDGDPKTFWGGGPLKSPTKLTDETVAASCAAIRWVCEFIGRHGGAVSKIVAHRQSSMSRRNDPGEAIWRRVALPMVKELGFDREKYDGGPGFEIGGRPVPGAWDDTRKGVAY